jgi:hypothetical protein
MAQATFGVREFVNLFLFFIAFYNRHRDNIRDAAGDTVGDALDTLASAEDAIRALNAFGPL